MAKIKYLLFGSLVVFHSALFGVEASEYKARRAAVAKAIGPTAMLILMSPATAPRNGDVDWPFYQDDYLYYLTGVDAPNTSLVLLPGDKSEFLFARDHNVVQESWTGKVATHEQLTKQTAIARVESASKLDELVKAAIEGLGFGQSEEYGYYRTPVAPKFFKLVKEGKAQIYLLFDRRYLGNASADKMLDKLRARYPELLFRDASPVISALREIKSPAEIALIQRAVDITIEGQKAAMLRAKSADYEYQVQATLEFQFRDKGAGLGFPSIVVAGENATVLHNPKQDSPIAKSSLMIMDAGAAVDHYGADVTVTFPASGKFSETQKSIYEAVLRINREVMREYKPKNTLARINKKARELAGKELLKLGLITDAADIDQLTLFFLHGMTHPLGLAVHDVFDRQRALEAGMVATNEPGIYINAARVRETDAYKKLSDADKARIEPALVKYDGIGVRIEDDVLVTKGEPKLLSANLPRTVSEIELFLSN